MPRPLARLLLLSQLIDRSYRFFDRLRSTLVLTFASDAFLEEYNALVYAKSSSFNPSAAGFRRGLFDWEKTVIDQHFPPPPARILVGGAGGGREPLALLDRGYDVVAFDPADHLVREMGRLADARLLPLIGGYGQLPRLRALGGGEVNLAEAPRFDAGIMGWTSFSHLRSDAERVAALRAFGALTSGPFLMSYFSDPAKDASGAQGRRIKGWLTRRARSRGHSVFSAHLGYYRLLQHSEVLDAIEAAGLRVIADVPEDNFPSVVLMRP